jgi:hypothetical protein
MLHRGTNAHSFPLAVLRHRFLDVSSLNLAVPQSTAIFLSGGREGARDQPRMSGAVSIRAPISAERSACTAAKRGSFAIRASSM